MFLYEPLTIYTIASFFAVLGGLILLNEVARRSKAASLFLFLVLPLVLPFTIWSETAMGEDSTVSSWFHWVKVYSVLAGCWAFMALRYIKGASKNKFLMLLPPIILAVNIFEAVIRDFQVSTFEAGIHDGLFVTGGPWNIINGIAGILNIITICGWAGIYITKDKYRDMVWPDQMWFWIVAYDFWNFSYIYNAYPDHSFYAGLILLLSCTIPAFFFKKGAWLQHRAHTLALYMMFVMSFPTFVDNAPFAIKATHNPNAFMAVALVSLISNIAVFIYQLYTIRKRKLNPLKDEIYTHHAKYQEVANPEIKPQLELANAQ